MKVLLTWQATPAEVALFAAALPQGTCIVAQAVAPCFSRLYCDLAAIAPQLADADAFVGWVLPPGARARAGRLKLTSGCMPAATSSTFRARGSTRLPAGAAH